MMGIEGTFIRRKQETDKYTYIYTIEPHLENSLCEVSLKQLCSKILPLCVAHDKVESFIHQHSSFNYGTVNQALCAGL